MITPSRRMITLPPEVTKSDSGRHVFYSQEAEHALNEWMNDREKYIKKNNAIVAGFKTAQVLVDIDDPRVFPYDIMSINRSGIRPVKKREWRKRTGTDSWNFIHTLSENISVGDLRLAKCPDSVVECLLGHVPYLKTYLNLPIKTISECV